MKCQIAPVKVSDLVPFSSSLNSSFASQAPKAAFAGISKNGLWMWVVCDTVINIYHTENSERFGGYCFGKSLKKSSAKITAVTEFCSSHISFPCLLIAVNHDHESIICMYDIKISKVVRAVLVPDMVLTLEVVSGNGGACMDTHHLFVQLRYMFGIVAVGTSTGHLYFLDLCLDEDFTCDENLPNITYVIKKYELLPEHREMALSRQQHMLMLLNDQSTRNGSFEFESRSSSLGYFPYGKVHVTALKYIQSTVTLAMGFNFGGIQLWDLQDLCLLYTVANQPQEQPIIAFAFQEPENDPRHFCYLWIIRGHLANERPEDFSVATMYSLIYGKRTYVESFGNLYTDLRNCTKRFEYRLTSDPYSSAQSSSAAGSSLLSCQTVCQIDETHLADTTSANESDTAPENMSLCFLSWLVWSTSDNFPTSYHLALFDLNQWYRAEMPSSNLRCDPSDLNPYFAHFSLEEVAQIFDLEPILGVYGIPHSIKKFKFISPSEEFFYPSSLDFQTILYSTNGICKATFLGLQKRLLYEIADMAPNVLINPKDFYSDLMRSGLISDLHGTSERVPLIVQREALLQLALEYHLPFFFMKCLKDWRYADSIQEGCTSRALLNWAWKKVIYVKNSIDRLSLPLFNCSGCDVDKASLKCLYSYRKQLDLIDTILMGYQKFAAPRTEQGIQELKCRKDVVFYINTYLQVLLWLRTVHVLPEVCEGEETEKNVLYPVNALLKTYHKRRSQLQKIHNSIGTTDILLIDGLVKEVFSDNTWQEKGGNGIYPPPSIYAALSCYLMDDIHLELKHSLMYYLLLDICNAPSNINSSLAAEVEKFPVVFGMSQSVSELVKAFWFLDQFNFEVAIKRLLHPAVKASDILPWQHHRVIKSFLFQREAQKALKYINHMDPPENTIEDMKLHLSVLLSRGAITQAFYYQRSKQSEGFGKDLLNHLFLGCQETHKLKELMYLPLNALESSALVQFLSENDDPRAQEALVMYHLLHCNFFEAAKVNGKLSINVSGKSASTHQRTAGRDALVEGLLASVPKTEKNLIEEINRFPSYPVKPGDVLKPLSLSIKNAPLKHITYSDILNSLISEASSKMCAPYLEPHTPFKTKSSYDDIPFLRPPLTPERTRISSETVFVTPVAKRTLTSPASEFSSPSKKSRLLDNAPFKPTSLTKKKIPKHLVGDVASLLQSPPIHRRGSKIFKEGTPRDSSVTAPQGILKKKVEPSKFPLSDIYTSRTPSVLSDAGEDSDDEERQNEKMVVEEVFEDIPGRQIRFSVPRKDDSNASGLCVDVETSVNNKEASTIDVLNESTTFLKRLDDFKPVSSLGVLDSSARKFSSVTQRKKTLQSLTREPLKAHSRQSPEKRFTVLDKLESGKLSASDPIESKPFSLSLSQCSSPAKTNTESEFVDISDSDSSPAIEKTEQKLCENVEPVKSSSESASMPSSSNIHSSTPVQSSLKGRESELQFSSDKCSTESVLNTSGSSGNSSYNSTSERSFIITPRRPLRDNTKNISSTDTSMVSAAEGEATLLGSESGNSEDEDNDVSIIGEVPVPTYKESGEFIPVISSASGDIPVHRRASTESVEEIDNLFCVSEVEICEVPNYTVSCNDNPSYVVQLVEDSESNNLEGKSMDIPGNSDFIVENIEEVIESTSETVTVVREKVDVVDVIDRAAEEVIDLIENQVDKAFESPLKGSPESSPKSIQLLLTDAPQSLPKEDSISSIKDVQDAIESHTKDVPEAFDITKEISLSSIPAYVPLKERIKFSNTSDSEFTKYDDNEEETYPSLLIREQMEFQMQDQVFENKETFLLKEQPVNVESDAKSVGVEESSKHDEMETETHAAENSPDSLPPTLTPTQNFSERFDFLSKHSNIYESNKLFRETFNVLKESVVIPPVFEFNPGRKSRKTRTFVFEKSKTAKTSTTSTNISNTESLHSKTKDEPSSTKEFLESWQPETYEQFSYSIQKGSSDDGEKKNIRSSPNVTPENSSVSLFNESSISGQSVSGMRGRRKKQESSKKDTSVDKRQKSTIKKAKSKISKKMEFSFAEPHSAAGPEILEALTTPSEYPVGSFMFSPPLTRGRLRQKRMDETLGSSFASVTSEVSFAQSKKPPVDPILEEIMAEKAPEPRKMTDIKTTSKSSIKKKPVAKKTPRANVSQLTATDTSINTSNVDDETEDLSTSKVLSSLKHVPKHRMVLRQTKGKP